MTDDRGERAPRTPSIGVRLIGLALLVVIVVLAIYGVAGSSRLSGPVILDLRPSHGIHRDDLVIVALAGVGALLCLRLAYRG